jgi:hypothetical protein
LQAGQKRLASIAIRDSTRKKKGNFTIEQAMKAQRGEKVQLYSFFNPGSTWRWVVNAKPWPFLPPGKSSGTYCRGWVGPKAGPDVCGESGPTGIRYPDRPARIEFLDRLSYPGLTTCSPYRAVNTNRLL